MVQAEGETRSLNSFDHILKAGKLLLGILYVLDLVLVGNAEMREHALDIEAGQFEYRENIM